DPAHGADREADEVGAEAGQQSDGRVLGGKEQRSEDEGRCEAVERKVVVLERAAERAGPPRPMQVLGRDPHLVSRLATDGSLRVNTHVRRAEDGCVFHGCSSSLYERVGVLGCPAGSPTRLERKRLRRPVSSVPARRNARRGWL